MNVRNRYLINDYMNDRNALRDPSRLTPAKTGVMLKSPAEAKMVGVGVNTLTQPGQTAGTAQTSAAAAAPKIERPQVQQPTQTTVTPEATTGTGLTEADVRNMLTSADVQNKMNSVLTDLMDFMNRKFEYNPKESPLYSILQKQAAEEARIASGRAYSRAVANAGGFGSSYATLAAEEASRQVMEGLDDQQLALYQAAKDEWDSKWGSLTEQYAFWSSVQDKMNADEKAGQDLLTDAIAAVRNGYGTDYNEAAITADLRAMNLSDEQIAKVLANQKEYSEAMKTGTEPGVIPESVRDAAEALRTAYGGEYYSPKAMSAYLKSLGYTDQEITQALEVQRGLAAGTELDKKATNASEAITYGAEINNALANGILTQEEYAVAQKRNSEVIRTDVLNKLSGDLTDEEAGEYLEEAAQYAREGYMTVDDFKNILKNQMEGVLVDAQAEAKGGKIDNLKEARGIITSVQAYMEFVENGTMTESDFEEMIDFFKNNDVMKAAYKHLDFIAGNDGTIDRLSEDENEALSVIFAAMDSPQKAELRQLEKDYEEFTNLNYQLITLESQYAQAGYENPRTQAEEDLSDVVARINEIGSKYGVDPFTGELKRLLRDWRKR